MRIPRNRNPPLFGRLAELTRTTLLSRPASRSVTSTWKSPQDCLGHVPGLAWEQPLPSIQVVNPSDLTPLLPRLRAMALYALGNSSTADDVAQEAVARALARADEIRDTANVAGFVAGIARHIIADHIRAKQRIEVDVHAIEIPHAHPDALAQLMADEQRVQLRTALRQLSAADCEILRLSYVEGLGAAEVGNRLNETSMVVRKRKSRAVERLRAAYLRIAEPDDPSHNRPPDPTIGRDPVSFQPGGTVG